MATEKQASPMQAVVLSGGGADGAYQVGALKALLEGQAGTAAGLRPVTDGAPLDPQVFAGTSIGSFNASYLVSHWQEHGTSTAGRLEKVWTDRMAWRGVVNGGFRLRLLPLELLDPSAWLASPVRPFLRFAGDAAFLGQEGVRRAFNLMTGKEPFMERVLELFNLSDFVSVEPWRETIEKSIDFEKIRCSRKVLTIAATNWKEGEVEYFGNQEMTDALGPTRIRASSAVPAFYPPARISGQKYVDGAVLENTPLTPATRALVKIMNAQKKKSKEHGEDYDFPGAVLHVIYMNPEVEKIPLDRLDSTLETLFRSQIIAWSALLNNDIDLAKRLNAEAARNQAAGSKELYPMPLTIHRYFPPDGLGGALGFLDLGRSRLEKLIADGVRHTVDHDCKANGCVFPEKRKAPRKPTAAAAKGKTGTATAKAATTKAATAKAKAVTAKSRAGKRV